MLVLEPFWSVWNPWSTCSHTCGGGNMVRFRNCSTGQAEDCRGPAVDNSTCNIAVCPTGIYHKLDEFAFVSYFSNSLKCNVF